MKLTDHLIDFIKEEARKKGWINPHTKEISIAELARNSNYTEATWSRIMRKKQKTIKDDVAAAIGDMFDASPIDILMISAGEQYQALTVKETAPPYGSEPEPVYADGFDIAANHFRHADETAQQAFFKFAIDYGLKLQHIPQADNNILGYKIPGLPIGFNLKQGNDPAKKNDGKEKEIEKTA